MTENAKPRDSDPTASLTLEDLKELVGDEDMEPVRQKAQERMNRLASLPAATLERNIRKGSMAAAKYVDKTIRRTPNDVVKLPPAWTKATTLAERAAIIDRLLAKGKISPAQAKVILDLDSAVKLAKELAAARHELAEIRSERERPAAPSDKTDEPKSRGVSRVLPNPLDLV